MPYIGRDLNRGNYLKLDDISSSFNSSTQTFNLTVGGSAFTPGSAFSILVSLGGVIQEPESAYQVNNSEITFANAPTAQDSFFCIALGVALGIGVPGNGTVNGTQLAKPFNYDGYFYLDDANNRVGINSSIPTASLDVIGNIKLNGNLVTGSGTGALQGNVYAASGISTFYDVRVTNNLTVEGTTTTLDTVLTEVDKLEVAANNTTVGAAITQSGTGDIINLFDGSTEVLTVKDGGKVGINTTAPQNNASVQHYTSTARHQSFQSTDGDLAIVSDNNSNPVVYIKGTGNADLVRLYDGSSQVITVDDEGKVGIGSGIPSQKLDVVGNIKASGTITGSSFVGALPISSDGNNRVITATGSGGLNGESTLTYSGNGVLNLMGASGNTQLALFRTDANTTGTTGTIGFYASDNDVVAGLYALGDGDNEGAHLVFKTTTAASGTNPYSDLDERLRIKSDGGILQTKTGGNANYTISRNESVGITNQAIGVLDFASNTGHTVQARVMGKTRGTSNVGGDLVFETRPDGGSLDEKVRITGDGRLGIGTDTPTYPLQVHDSSAGGLLRLLSGHEGNYDLRFVYQNNETNIWSYASSDMTIGTRYAKKLHLVTNGPGKRLTIDDGGRVGIGTQIPDIQGLEIGYPIGTGAVNLLKLTSYTNSQNSRPALVFWNNNPNTAQAQISAKGGSSYNASKLHFSVANSSRVLQDRACIDEFGTFIIGPGETRRNTKGSNQHQVLLIEGTGNNSTRMSMIRNSNDDNGPEIQLIKTRGTSIGSVTKPNQDDYIGSLVFIGGDDSDLFSRGAEIAVQAKGTPANDRIPSDIIFSTTPTSGATSPQQRVRITSEGNVGINIPSNSSVHAKLNIKDTSNDGAVSQLLKLGNDSSGSGTGAGIQLGVGAGNASQAVLLSGFYDGTGTSFTVETCNTFNGAQTEKFRISNDGRTTIGYTDSSSSSILHLRSNTSAETTLELSTKSNYNGSLPAAKISFTQQNGTEIARIKCDTNTGAANMADLTFWTNYGGLYERMRISKTGQVGIGTNPTASALEVKGDITVYNSNNQGDIFFGENGNVSNSKALIRMDQLSSTSGMLQFHTEGGGTLTERLRIQSTGGVQISAVKNMSATASNHTGTFNSAELIMTTPTYSEYHYTWSGHSSYTIDLTCGSYFHSEIIYVQHQTNGGGAMQAYIRGKWANNHQTHTLMIHEWSGGAAGLLVDMVASDQNGNGAVNGEDGLTAQGWSSASYRGMYGGGGENWDNTSAANGRLRISESYGHWANASVGTRGLIVRVYFGSFAISKS